MSSLEKPTSHRTQAQDVTKLPIFASAPASLKPFIQGKTIVEVIANIKDNVENADDHILDDFDAWMRKLNPNYCAPVRDPHFIRIAKDKETLRTLFRSDRFELKQKTAFMEKTLINESRDVIKEFCSWKFENLGEDYPFLSLIRDAACRKLLLNIMSNPDNGDTVKLEKLDKALSGMNDRSAKIIYENWRKTIDAERKLMRTDEPMFVDTFEKMRPVTNILILGETGIGKSTFINGLVNYLHYDTLEDAENDQLHVLIESWITHYNEDGSSRKIAIRPTGIPQYGQSNEHTMVGQSSTQDPMDYIFEYNCGKVKRVVRIIDTPGIGDTRGIEQDSLNYEKILQFLCGIDKIDAIMILMKPNCARLTLMFQFCVDELLVHLHKDAAKNVFFCFTNASASQFTPGESLPALREHLSKLDLDKIQLNLGEDSERFFCFDNESFRYLTARNHGAKFPETERRTYAESWRKSSQQAIRLFERIAATQPHDVELTLNLNNSRAAIFRVTEPLADLAQAQLINERVINEKIKEVEDCENSEDEDERKIQACENMLRKWPNRPFIRAVRIFSSPKITVEKVDLSVERTVYKKNPTQLPQMVCMAPCCVDNVKLRPEETRTTPVPKRACHADCPTQGIIPETFPNPGIQQCEIIDLSTLQCRVCGCSWSIHTHLMYTYEKTTEKYVDPRVLEMEQKEGKTKETRELFVQTLKAELTAQSAKKQEIMNVVGGKVSEFLKDCIVSHNAAYGDYLNLEIKTERDKEQSERVPGYLDRLNKLKGRFDAQVELIKNCSKEPRKSLKTFDEIIMELGLASDDSTVLKPKPTPPFSGASITVKRTPPLPKRVIFGINP